MGRNAKKKKIFIFSLLATVIVAVFFCVIFLTLCSNKKSLKSSLQGRETISYVIEEENSTTILIESENIQSENLIFEFSDNISRLKPESKLTYKDFLSINFDTKFDKNKSFVYIGVSFLSDIPHELDLSLFQLFFQASFENIKTDAIRVNVTVEQININTLFLNNDLGSFLIAPNENEIIERLFFINQETVDKSYFEGNKIKAVISIDTSSATVEIINSKQWIGHVNVKFTFTTKIDLTKIILEKDLTSDGIYFVEKPTKEDVMWKVEKLNNIEKYLSFWNFISIEITNENQIGTAKLIADEIFYTNSIWLSFSYL